jgi:hypothetical protein
MTAFRPRGAGRRPPSVPRSALLAAGRLSAAVRGCICEPDYEVWHDRYGPRVTIRHDRPCPADPDHEEATR